MLRRITREGEKSFQSRNIKFGAAFSSGDSRTASRAATLRRR